jgi:hypothetical protein
MAHRVVYERVRGPIPKGLVLDHLCRNPGCVNPEHLEPVSQATNLRRAMSRLTPEDVAEIRHLRYVERQIDLATRFGVSRSSVANIQRWYSWKG